MKAAAAVRGACARETLRDRRRFEHALVHTCRRNGVVDFRRLRVACTTGGRGVQCNAQILYKQ